MLPKARRRSPTTITPEIIARIRRLSPRLLQDEIAMMVGVCQATVARIQKKHAIPHPDRHFRKLKRAPGAVVPEAVNVGANG